MSAPNDTISGVSANTRGPTSIIRSKGPLGSYAVLGFLARAALPSPISTLWTARCDCKFNKDVERPCNNQKILNDFANVTDIPDEKDRRAVTVKYALILDTDVWDTDEAEPFDVEFESTPETANKEYTSYLGPHPLAYTQGADHSHCAIHCPTCGTAGTGNGIESRQIKDSERVAELSDGEE